MAASIEITVRPYWLSSLFLRAFAKPLVFIDGNEHAAAWGIPLKSSVNAGDHVISAGIRYRGSTTVLGVSPTTFTVEKNSEIYLHAHNGLLNHTPFSITKVTADANHTYLRPA